MLYEIVIYGIVQGITEFLPISSSAHLILVSKWLSGEEMTLSLNVALHAGTMIAILIYFRSDWISIFSEDLKRVRAKKPLNLVTIKLSIATIPAVCVGLLFRDSIVSMFHHAEMTAYPLIVVGVLMWVIDLRAEKKLGLPEVTHRPTAKSVSLKESLIVGCAQCLALIPGVSRSGITMSAARVLNLTRVESARLSFLLGTPIMLGATAMEFLHIDSQLDLTILAVGIGVSFVSGMLAIHVLLKSLQRFGFGVYSLYRVLLGLFILYLFST